MEEGEPSATPEVTHLRVPPSSGTVEGNHCSVRPAVRSTRSLPPPLQVCPWLHPGVIPPAVLLATRRVTCFSLLLRSVCGRRTFGCMSLTHHSEHFCAPCVHLLPATPTELAPNGGRGSGVEVVVFKKEGHKATWCTRLGTTSFQGLSLVTSLAGCLPSYSSPSAPGLGEAPVPCPAHLGRRVSLGSRLSGCLPHCLTGLLSCPQRWSWRVCL